MNSLVGVPQEPRRSEYLPVWRPQAASPTTRKQTLVEGPEVEGASTPEQLQEAHTAQKESGTSMTEEDSDEWRPFAPQ